MAYPHQNLHPPRDPTVFASAAGYHGIPHRRLENNGPIDLPKTHVNGPSNSASTPPARLLTVDEALQFSPLSSIVPFNPNIIPIPTASVSAPHSLFPTLPEQQNARQSLELLNKDVVKQQGQSSLSQKAFKELKACLEQGAVTEFKFKSLQTVAASSEDRKNECSTFTDHLSPFAKMLFEGTDLAHRYPTPSSSDTASPPKRTNAKPPKAVSNRVSHVAVSSQQPLPTAPPTPPNAAHNEVAFTHNSHLSPAGQNPSLGARQSQCPAIIVPPLPPDAHLNEYVTIQDVSGSRKRRREDGTSYATAATQTQDGQVAADEASSRLSDMVQEILEAEDQSSAGIIARDSTTNAQFFVPTTSGHHSGHTLAPAIQVRLEAALAKSISLNRLCDIPVETLSRLQRLCENAITSAESSELEVDPSWNDDEVLHWAARVEDVDLGLRSARTVLRIMTADRQEKELYPEELLHSVIRLLDRVLKSCIIPVVEARNNDMGSALFQAATRHKKTITHLLHDLMKAMRLLVDLLAKMDMAENIVNALEFFATHTLFVENAHMDKDSVLGIQKFETLRRTAMDIITEIFSRYPEQRASIFDEILTSLQKLPTMRQQARQYKLPVGINIQLVSALILRLVQISARRISQSPPKDPRSNSPLSDGGSRSEPGRDSRQSSEESETGTKSINSKVLQKLLKLTNSLSDAASKSAQYVVRFFVSRAMNAPKTGDQPHRHLLDMFCEDMIAVLGLPEWPAAELLLRALLIHMVEIVENPKFNAPAKNMALELLGLMGSAMTDLVDTTRRTARGLENDDSDFSGCLQKLLNDYIDGGLETGELLGWQGPYRAVVESLQPTDRDDSQLHSAQAYYLTQWAKAVASGGVPSESRVEKTAIQLHRSLLASKWITSDSSELPTNMHNRLAYALTVLNMDFCRQFDRVFKILLDSISSEQITVRTRSLKSVTQMLEKDPSLLDRARNIRVLIMNCATDRSSMVRDSALMLIGKCTLLRPSLEQEFCKTVLTLSNDPAVGVRKRAMKLLKDMYLRNSKKEMRSAICDSLLQRTKDPEKSVSDLALQTFEDIWMSPLWGLGNATEAKVQEKLALANQVSLIVKTVQRGDNVSSVLASLIEKLHLNSSRNAPANLNVCKALVAAAFDGMIYTEDATERQEQKHILQTLTVFAKANAKLFDPAQLKHLQPYISNLSTSDELYLFRYAVAIFRCVLPAVPSLQHTLLREVQNALLQSVSKLGVLELDEVAACLWTINGALVNPEKLGKLMISVLKNLHPLKAENLNESSKKEVVSRKKYIRIAGYFGKHCDFEDQAKVFHESFTWWKGSSVAGLIIDCIFPYANNRQQLTVKADAFNSIGLICQSRPYQFNEEHISNAFAQVLAGDEPELQNVVLSGFRDFFVNQEEQSELKQEIIQGEGKQIANGKLGASMTASDSDSASALIAQRFLKCVLRISLAGLDVSALTATEVIASINRQGLVHPKESAPALVALETSSNAAIAEIALLTHRNLHQQHESMFEREYMRAINEAFKYQKNIVKDTSGFTIQPYAAKLGPMFDIIKSSKGKYQKKFLSGLCSKINFEPSKVDVTGHPPTSLEYARFLLENLAFFEYPQIDELLHVIACMESIVSSTGTVIAHGISTELFRFLEGTMLEEGDHGAQKEGQQSADADVDPLRLRQLTTGSIILSAMWETRTFLRRLYGLHSNQQRRESKSKASSRDLSKAPAKTHGISGESFLAGIAEKVKSLESHEGMFRQCKDFVELLSVDSELKVTSEGEDGEERPQTPSGDEGNTPVPASGGSRPLKRKGSLSAAGTPHRKKKGRPSLSRKKSGKSAEDDDYGSD